MGINNDEEVTKLLRTVCRPVAARPEFKQRVRQSLTSMIAAAEVSYRPLWKQPRVWAPIAAMIVLAAIAYGVWLSRPPVTPAEHAGILEIRVTDAPPGRNISQILVHLTNIEVHKAGDQTGDEGRWIMVIEEAKSFDLIGLRGVEEILGEEELPTGHYTQIRMDVEIVGAVVNGESTSVDVVLPGGKLKLVGSFEIGDNQKTVLTLDFDADASLVPTGEGKVQFKPVVKLVVSTPG